MGVKGGCSPQNNLPKSGQLLPELKRRRNKNFYKLYSPFRNSLVSPGDNVDLKGHSCSEREEFPTTCGRLRYAF